MKKKNLVLCSSILLMTLVLVSCSAKKTNETKSQETTTTQVSTEAPLVDTYTKVTFKIKDNPTTGYMWDVTMTGDGKMELEKEWTDLDEAKEDPEKGHLVGAPHFLYKKYKPTKAGHVNFEFRHHQPWKGGDEGYAFNYEYDIKEDLSFELAGDIIGNQIPNEKSELEIYATYESVKK